MVVTPLTAFSTLLPSGSYANLATSALFVPLRIVEAYRALAIARGVPNYTDADTLMLEGAGELLALPDGSLQPIVEAGEDCICLVAMEGKLQLLGLFGRIMQPFVRL